jgi:hypothetical protein
MAKLMGIPLIYCHLIENAFKNTHETAMNNGAFKRVLRAVKYQLHCTFNAFFRDTSLTGFSVKNPLINCQNPLIFMGFPLQMIIGF